MNFLDPHNKNNDFSSRNLLVAMAISMVVIIGYDLYRAKNLPPRPVAEKTATTTAPQAAQPVTMAEGVQLPGKPEAASLAPAANLPTEPKDETRRVPIENKFFQGAVALKGGRIDKLSLPQYKVALDGEERITLFKPSGNDAHFFDAGWLASGTPAPDNNTLWQTETTKLTPGTPLTLVWDNGSGIVFRRTYTLDGRTHAIRVNESARNVSTVPVSLAPYAQIHKAYTEQGGGMYNAEQSTFYNFLGPTGVVDGIRAEHGYDDLTKERTVSKEGTTGWVGITSRYFMAALVPDQATPYTFQWRYNKVAGQDYYSAVMQHAATTLAPGSETGFSYTLYAGPKSVPQLEPLASDLPRAVDYGWFHVIAEPLHNMIAWFGGKTGNLGIGIVLATLVLKILLFPLANKSYRAMATMKKIQPQMERLKERYGNDRERFAAEMMAMYREHRVNPMSGCWPMLIQIPIFFAFYKAILVSFEFRHAPLGLWITDLSVKDPYFVLPLLMGISMFLQMQMSPPAADPIQKQVMRFMPIVFTFLFLWFPAGLVLYWLTNNVLSIGQQWWITKRVSASG